MKTETKNEKIIQPRLIAFLYLALITLTITTTSILFILGGTINSSLLLFNMALAVLVVYFVFKKDYTKKQFLWNVILMVISFFFLCYFSMIFYDVSYDGNVYHKQMIGLMKNGLNPLYNMDIGDIYSQHYANATEIWGAVLYSFFNNIEAGKVINILLAFCLFVFVSSFLQKKNIKKPLAILFSLALAVNPIFLNQFHSYYIDSVVASSLFLTIFALIKMIDEKADFKNKDTYFILIGSIIICCNVKFQSVLLCGMFAVLLGGFEIIRHFLNKNYDMVKKLTALFVFVFLFSILVVGSSSYVKNYAKFGHPFYPLRGNTEINIESGNEPPSFEQYNHFEKFLYATFSKTYTWYDRSPELKIPFTVSASEMNSIKYPDIRIGGLGVWYSGMLLLSIPMIIYGCYKLIKQRSKWAIVMGLMLFGIIAPIPFLPVVWQARYYPQIYLLPFIGTLCLMFSKSRYSKHFAFLAILVALGNSLFLVPQAIERYHESIDINNSLVRLANESLTKQVYISKDGSEFYGTYYNYLDKNIRYKYSEDRLEDAHSLYYGALYKIEGE